MNAKGRIGLGSRSRTLLLLLILSTLWTAMLSAQNPPGATAKHFTELLRSESGRREAATELRAECGSLTTDAEQQKCENTALNLMSAAEDSGTRIVRDWPA